MATSRHLREFFTPSGALSDRGRQIVVPHWQIMWSALGRGEKVLPVSISATPERLQGLTRDFQTFAEWQLGSAGIDAQKVIPASGWADGTGAAKHFDALTMDDLMAPKTFDRHPQLAIMASGGIDFAIALAWAHEKLAYEAEDIAVIYVDYGAEHAKKADAVLRRTEQWARKHALWVFRFTAKTPGGRLIDPTTLPGGHKVYRNAMLASIGSLLAPNVWVLAGAAQDQRADHASRSTRFFAETSSVLSQQHGRPVHVNSPFRHLSKPDLFGWFVRRFGEDAYQMFEETSDCDAKSALACGNCRSCFKFASMMLKVGDKKLTDLCLKRFDGIQTNEKFLEYCFSHYGYVTVGDETTIRIGVKDAAVPSDVGV